MPVLLSKRRGKTGMNTGPAKVPVTRNALPSGWSTQLSNTTTWQCRNTTNNTPSYLDTKRTVTFAEHQHWVGVDQLLYSGFKFCPTGVILDGRHDLAEASCFGARPTPVVSQVQNRPDNRFNG